MTIRQFKLSRKKNPLGQCHACIFYMFCCSLDRLWTIKYVVPFAIKRHGREVQVSNIYLFIINKRKSEVNLNYI